jgi:predicted nuclease of predicted toxin-antitoxin system
VKTRPPSIHDDHFEANAKDEIWLKVVGEENWIVLTKDKFIKYRRAEWEQVKKYKIRMFTLVRGNFTGKEMAEIFIKNLRKIKNIILNKQPPYIYKVPKHGKLIQIL